MIKVNIEEALKKLEETRKVLENKMKNMVAGFAYTVTDIASNNTPIGDPFTYYSLYKLREDEWKIPIGAGFHQGAWKYSESPGTTLVPVIFSEGVAANNAFSDAKARYNLGEQFYIAANGPGYGLIESGGSTQAPQGVMSPSTEQIMQVAGINLKKYFEEG